MYITRQAPYPGRKTRLYPIAVPFSLFVFETYNYRIAREEKSKPKSKLNQNRLSRMSSQPPDLVTFGPDANCTLETCDISWSVFGYRPSLVANIAFIVLFGGLGVVHAYLGFRWKSWGFMVGMLLGCVCELIGYCGRVMLWNNPFSFIAFMIQISKCTMAEQ